MRTETLVRQTERWFVRQGVPRLIADYRFRTHVLPRMLPFLASVIVVVVVLALLLPRVGPGFGAVAAGVVAGLFSLVGVPWLLIALGRRSAGLGLDAGTAVLILYAAVALVVPVLLLGAYGHPNRALTVGRAGDSTAALAIGTALVLAAALAAIFVAAWLATAYGLVPLAVRALRHAFRDMRASLQLQGRALPTLLFVTFFLFFTGELWQLMNHLSWVRLVLVLVLFAAVTVLATAARLRGEVDRVEQDLRPERLAAACAGTPLAALKPTPTPAAPPPLTARQQTNLLLVLVFRQLVQAAVVGLGLFAFFVVLGLIVVDHTVAAAWIGAEPLRSAVFPFVPVALLRAASLLAGFGSMYFAITTMTQAEYRREFFEPVIEDVERTLAVRAVYLGLRATTGTVSPKA